MRTVVVPERVWLQALPFEICPGQKVMLRAISSLGSCSPVKRSGPSDLGGKLRAHGRHGRRPRMSMTAWAVRQHKAQRSVRREARRRARLREQVTGHCQVQRATVRLDSVQDVGASAEELVRCCSQDAFCD